ncbi:hypothetical protein K438DRAFT_1957514 [Mycena galopus ATCC 62051]|nr:hypothetical protein K438DRAFT_1957514 [Mycena galopus ATCC 62051]
MHLRVPRVPRREKGHPYHPSPTSPAPGYAQTLWQRYTAPRRPRPRTGKQKEGVISVRPLESTNTGPSRPPACVHTHCQAPYSEEMCLHPMPPAARGVPSLSPHAHNRAAGHDGARAAAKSDPTLLFIAPSPTHRAPRRWERTGNPRQPHRRSQRVAFSSSSAPLTVSHVTPRSASRLASSHTARPSSSRTTFPSIARASFLPHWQQMPGARPVLALRALRLRVDVTPTPTGGARSTTPSLRRPSRKPPPACHIRPRARLESVLAATDAPADAGGRAGPQRACADIWGSKNVINILGI